MSRMNTPGVIYVRPTNNIYTGLAFISMLVTLVALGYVAWRFNLLGVFA